jgi:cysteine desulfurase
MRRIYLDHASTTYTDPKVCGSMEPYWSKSFGNPSSIHKEGREAKKAINRARDRIAAILNVQPRELVFTGSGTESDNLAILGAARANKDKGKHIVTTQIEHHAVLRAAERLKKEGFEVSYVGVDREGIINLEELKDALRKDTVLVSVMYANNEIGTIQPLVKIAKIIRNFKKTLSRAMEEHPFFHTDAAQAAGYLDLNAAKLGVDLLSINGSKIYGPKGTGVLFVKRGLRIEPLFYGGSQERGLRSGTENVAGIVGLAEALALAQKSRVKEAKRLTELRDYLIDQILKKIPKAVLNGSRENRLPNNVNISFYGVEGESLVLYLDAKGVAASTGSACTSKKLEASHVIRALGRSYKYAHGSLRLSLGKTTTREDLDYVLEILPSIIKKLRKISAVK